MHLNYDVEKKVPWYESSASPGGNGVVLINVFVTKNQRNLFPANDQHKPAVQQV